MDKHSPKPFNEEADTDGENMRNEKAIGIDLGTTYTCIGIWNALKDRVDIITNEQGNQTTPSMVAFTSDEHFIGQSAMNQCPSNPDNTVFDSKRLIGRNFSDPIVQSDMKLWPFSVVNGADEKPMIRVTFKDQKKDFMAEEISAMILSRMKEISQDYLGCKVNKAVITVPAYFNNLQKEATKNAGKIAGLEVLRLLSEPTAAAIAYAHDNLLQIGKNVLVYDLGGGTFDVSIVHVNSKNDMVVRAVKGDTHLGGQDFDRRLVCYFVEEFERKFKVDISSSCKTLRKLITSCERAKRELSYCLVTNVEVLHEGRDLMSKITRAKFEQLILDLVKRTTELVGECIADAQLDKKDIASVILIGGSSRIPKVQDLLSDFFESSAKICRDINPDEAVAYGAALMSAHLTGDYNGLNVRDVTPLSLGVETVGELMRVIIPRNTLIPTKRDDTFFTTLDDQAVMMLDVYEGERPDIKDNLLLDKFTFFDIPPAPKGQQNVMLCMEIDENGILTVTATHKSTGNKQSLRVTRQFGSLSDSAIAKMREEAQRLMVEDQAWKEAALLRNETDDYLYDAKKKLQKLKGSMSSSKAKSIKKFIANSEKWLSENNNADKPTVQAKYDEIRNNCSKALGMPSY